MDPHGGSFSGITLEAALKSCEELVKQEIEPVPVWVLPASKDMSGRDVDHAVVAGYEELKELHYPSTKKG